MTTIDTDLPSIGEYNAFIAQMDSIYAQMEILWKNQSVLQDLPIIWSAPSSMWVNRNVDIIEDQPHVLSGSSVSVDCAVSTFFTHTITTDSSIASISALEPGMIATVVIKQDASGGHAYTTPAEYSTGILNTGAGESTAVTFINTGDGIYAVFGEFELRVVAPKVVSQPELTTPGGLNLGATITCDVSGIAGTELTLTYTWKRDGADIPGANNSTYVLTTADRLTELTCNVTATNILGEVQALSTALNIPQGVLTARTLVLDALTNHGGSKIGMRTITLKNAGQIVFKIGKD